MDEDLLESSDAYVSGQSFKMALQSHKAVIISSWCSETWPRTDLNSFSMLISRSNNLPTKLLWVD